MKRPEEKGYAFDQVFKALGDRHRLQILELLMERERNAGELLEAVDVVQSTLSHHMKSLCGAGLVEARKEGKWTYYAVSSAAVKGARQFLERYLSGEDEMRSETGGEKPGAERSSQVKPETKETGVKAQLPQEKREALQEKQVPKEKREVLQEKQVPQEEKEALQEKRVPQETKEILQEKRVPKAEKKSANVHNVTAEDIFGSNAGKKAEKARSAGKAHEDIFGVPAKEKQPKEQADGAKSAEKEGKKKKKAGRPETVYAVMREKDKKKAKGGKNAEGKEKRKEKEKGKKSKKDKN